MTQVNTVRAWLERASTQTTHDSFGHILFDNFLMFFLVPFGHDSFEVLMLSREGFFKILTIFFNIINLGKITVPQWTEVNLILQTSEAHE